MDGRYIAVIGPNGASSDEMVQAGTVGRLSEIAVARALELSAT